MGNSSGDSTLSLHSDAEPVRARRARRVALAVFAAVAAYFLWTEHRAHTLQALPWILLLLCPLMHVFMHRGHGSHEHDLVWMYVRLARSEEREALADFGAEYELYMQATPAFVPRSRIRSREWTT